MPDGVVLRKPSDESVPKSLGFHVEDASACLRIAAVGPERANVELTLLDPTGVELARDALPGPIALVSGAGPVCVSSAGDYRIELGMTGASGTVAIAVWRAP